MKKLYEKVGRRYVEVPGEHAFFPCDGIWLVQDNRHAMTCLIGIKESVPVYTLPYRQYVNDLCKVVQDAHKAKPMSLYDEMVLVCDFFAEKAGGQ